MRLGFGAKIISPAEVSKGVGDKAEIGRQKDEVYNSEVPR
jgi:hypothetical protein